MDSPEFCKLQEPLAPHCPGIHGPIIDSCRLHASFGIPTGHVYVVVPSTDRYYGAFRSGPMARRHLRKHMWRSRNSTCMKWPRAVLDSMPSVEINSIRSACNGSLAGSRKVPTRRTAPRAPAALERRMDRHVRGAASASSREGGSACGQATATVLCRSRGEERAKRHGARGHARLPPARDRGRRARAHMACARGAGTWPPGERNWLAWCAVRACRRDVHRLVSTA